MNKFLIHSVTMVCAIWIAGGCKKTEVQSSSEEYKRGFTNGFNAAHQIESQQVVAGMYEFAYSDMRLGKGHTILDIRSDGSCLLIRHVSNQPYDRKVKGSWSAKNGVVNILFSDPSKPMSFTVEGLDLIDVQGQRYLRVR